MADHDPHLASTAARISYTTAVKGHIKALRKLIGVEAMGDVLDVVQAVALANGDAHFNAAAALRERCRDVPGDYLGGEW